MPHEVALITTIAAALGVALVLGLVAVQLKLPALVGYLVAGVLIGPGTPGFVADVELSQQLAEIGVMLLMFGVGLHFSVEDLLAVRKIALPGALVQIAVATALGAGVAPRVGLAARRRARLRPVAVGREHRRAAARAREPRRARDARTAASRSAGSSSRISRWCSCSCCCRRSRRGSAATQPPRPSTRSRRRSRSRSARSRCSSRSCSWSAGAYFLGCFGRSLARARASSSRSA